MPLHDRSITIHLLFITRIHNLAEIFCQILRLFRFSPFSFGFLHFSLYISVTELCFRKVFLAIAPILSIERHRTIFAYVFHPFYAKNLEICYRLEM